MGLLYQPVFMLFALINVNPLAVMGPLYMGDVVLSGSVPSVVYRIVVPASFVLIRSFHLSAKINSSFFTIGGVSVSISFSSGI